MSRRKIAVIGSGVAGLTAAYVLQRCQDVTLYEADDRLGGHAHTHDLPGRGGRSLAIDTGFIVHNELTYPTLRRLFRELEITTQESDMSMSIRCGGCRLEYAGGRGLSGLLPTMRTLASRRYLRMLTEVVRFHRRARALLAGDDDQQTLAEFLAAGRFSRYFTAHFVTPLISAVWSCAPTDSGDYPARYLFVFLANHGMLSVTGSPTWHTVVGGSARYVERAVKGLTSVQTSTPIRAVARAGSGVDVHDESGSVERFDGAVIATHPHHALAMLARPSTAESAVLGAIGYTRNPTVLHTDASVLPRASRAQASWNYFLPNCTTTPAAVHVSYNMNRLQRLDTDQQYVVTLNGDGRIDQSAVLARMVYDHPVYTAESVAARQRLGELNDGVIAYAGAYHGWGFHEDGCRSGVQAAASLGADW
ncbi:MAG: FAD-dependent oxidoreductase [Actinomycetota bacterium]